MRQQGKRNPDHFQVHPSPVHDQLEVRGKSHRAQAKEVSKGLRRAEAAKERMIHAGEPLDHPHAVRCSHCDMETTLPAGQVVIACRNCGATSYRVIV